MTGPEHYLAAERRLAEAEDLPTGHADLATMLAEAQVHATLAQAAATVELVASRGPGDIGREWTDAVWSKADPA